MSAGAKDQLGSPAGGHQDPARNLLTGISDAAAGLPAPAGRPGRVAAIPFLALLAGLAVLPHPARAAEAVQFFGPGKVSCQPLTGTQLDCLLTASRVTDARNVATFGVDLLPAADQALFRKWCLAGTDACSVTLAGRRESPQSTRLSAVTSVHWTRPSAPENEEVARTADKTPAFEPKGGAAPR